MKLYHVYILKCSDGSFYTGMTSDLSKRLNQHDTGYYSTCYTFKRRPVKLVFEQAFTDPNTARMLEYQIKGWTRKKKIALIEYDFDLLSQLAKKKF